MQQSDTPLYPCKKIKLHKGAGLTHLLWSIVNLGTARLEQGFLPSELKAAELALCFVLCSFFHPETIWKPQEYSTWYWPWVD